MQPLVFDLAGPFSLDAPADAGLRCSVIRDFQEFRGQRVAWERLSEEIGSPAYLDWSYLEAWWKAFGGGEFHAVAVYGHDEVLALFPLFAERRSRLGFGLRRLRQVGYNGDIGFADMTEEPLAVVKPGFEDAAFRTLFEHLDQELAKGRFDCVEIRALYAGSAKLNACMPRGRSRFKSAAGSQIVCLPDSWEEYRRSLSKSMRDNLPYYPRLLTRSGHSWRVRYAHEGEELQRAVDALVRLQKLRVASDYGPIHIDHFPTSVQSDFVADVIGRMGGAGKGYVASLEVDGEVVAAQAYLESESQLLVWYSGFDPVWHRFSPVFVLEAEVIRGAMSRGVRTVNLLQGGAPWQIRWKPTQPATLSTALVVARQPDAVLRSVLWLFSIGIVKEVRRWMRRRENARRRQRDLKTPS